MWLEYNPTHEVSELTGFLCVLSTTSSSVIPKAAICFTDKPQADLGTLYSTPPCVTVGRCEVNPTPILTCSCFCPFRLPGRALAQIHGFPAKLPLEKWETLDLCSSPEQLVILPASMMQILQHQPFGSCLISQRKLNVTIQATTGQQNPNRVCRGNLGVGSKGATNFLTEFRMLVLQCFSYL